MRLLTLTFILCLALCATAVAHRDTISPALLEVWSHSPNDVTAVIVHLVVQADVAGMDDGLHQMKATRALRHRVITDALRETASATQGDLIAELNRMKNEGVVQGFKAYWISNCFVVFGLPSAIKTIADRNDVQWIEPNFKPVLIEPITRRHTPSPLDLNQGVPTGIRAIHAPQVWYDLGFTGAGRLVGGMDTGVDGNHPALAARWRGTHAPVSECWLNVLGGSPNFPVDNNHHGTHTMGTMCGNSLESDDSIGVAPEAEWISCNAIDQGTGGGFTNDVLDGYEWFADPDGIDSTIEDVPDVVQNSWGIDARFPGYQDCFEQWNDVILNCEAAGIVVTFSAGNEGPGAQTCRSPATIAIDSVTMFCIGAVDANSDTIPPYVIADFSSRGPSDCDTTEIKPEVCAPGVNVYSSTPGGNYEQAGWSGTSMAGPHVAGIVALMRQANPNAEVREIKSALMRTAIDFGPEGEDNSYGFGFVDAYEAVQLISANRAIIRGFVTDASNGAPIEGAVVAAGDAVVRTTDETGWYRMSVPADTTWILSCHVFGFTPQELETTVAPGDTVEQNFEMFSMPSGTLNGTVVAGDSHPVYNASVTFPGTPLAPLFTNEDGVFSTPLPGGASYAYRVEYHDAVDSGNVFIPTDDSVDESVVLESPRSDRQGPDDYGYKAYDNLDFGIAPELDWVEISPTMGGPGEILTLPARDSSAWIQMPFPFVYYGDTYDSLTINENGWLAAGVSHEHTFANTAIGSASGPTAMMAVFWDNLYDGSLSDICYWNDGDNGRAIIEYHSMGIFPDTTSFATFEIQIYSASARPTPTGDCEILCLYSGLDAANSSTVGVENRAENDGVQVLYNGTYGANSWLVAERTGILFTTRDSVMESGVPNRNVLVETPSLSSAYPNPFNNSTQLEFALPHSARVRMQVYDVLGRLAVTLADADYAAGNHTLTWNADGIAAGLYFIRMDAAGYSSTRKVLLLK